MIMLSKKLILVSVLALSTGCTATTITNPGENKDSLSIADVPSDVLALARSARPDLNFEAADMDIRNGIQYYDVEGTNAQGEEIELDIMQDGQSWKIVEIQRDLEFADIPEDVRTVYDAHVSAKPARIIESDQDNGMIIYEFYVLNANATKQEKHEIMLEDGHAKYLDEEWKH